MTKKENNPNPEGFTLPLPEVMVVITPQSLLFSNTWLSDTVVIVAGWDTIFSTIKYLYYKKVAFAMVLLELLSLKHGSSMQLPSQVIKDLPNFKLMKLKGSAQHSCIEKNNSVLKTQCCFAFEIICIL